MLCEIHRIQLLRSPAALSRHPSPLTVLTSKDTIGVSFSKDGTGRPRLS